MMDGFWLSEFGRNAKPVPGGKVITMRAELLPIAGAVSNPRARTIEPRRRRSQMIVGTLLYAALILAPWMLLIGLVYGLLQFALWLWRWAEPAFAILGIGVALAVIVIGIGLPG